MKQGQVSYEQRKIQPVILECGDVAHFYPAPRIGDIVYCQTCRDFRQVQRRNRATTPQIKIKCADCQYARHFGPSEVELARITGDTHSLRRGHAVWIIGQDGNRTAI